MGQLADGDAAACNVAISSTGTWWAWRSDKVTDAAFTFESLGYNVDVGLMVDASTAT